MTAPNKKLLGIVAAVPLLLLLPFLAMQFSPAVDWDSRDFLIMGILLLITGLFCEFAIRKIKKTEHLLFVIGILLVLFLLVWGELATGYFRTHLQGHVMVETTLLLPSVVTQ